MRLRRKLFNFDHALGRFFAESVSALAERFNVLGRRGDRGTRDALRTEKETTDIHMTPDGAYIEGFTIHTD